MTFAEKKIKEKIKQTLLKGIVASHLDELKRSRSMNAAKLFLEQHGKMLNKLTEELYQDLDDYNFINLE